jgi:hypothetical protein
LAPRKKSIKFRGRVSKAGKKYVVIIPKIYHNDVLKQNLQSKPGDVEIWDIED